MFTGFTPPVADRSAPQSSWTSAHASFLATLSATETLALEQAASTITLKKRDTLFSAGDPAEQVYIVTRGCIKLYQISAAGRVTIVWLSLPGELLGVAETFDGSAREIFAEAHSDSGVLVITKARFIEFLQSCPEAAMRAIGILSARLRALGASIADLASDDVTRRLIHFLVRQAASGQPTACRAVQRPGEICLNIEFTHSDLANLIGASRQTVSSILTDLRRRGLIDVIGRHLHLMDTDGLHSLLADS